MTRNSGYSAEKDADFEDDLVLFANVSIQAESLLHNLKQAARGIVFYMNPDKTEFLCFKQGEVISILSGKDLQLVDKFTYFDSNISSTESDINIHIVKTWTAFDWL